MKAVNLASGSDGNLTYIESNGTKLLVDIGLSCKETEKRLALLGLSGDELDAILITHEHSDHVKGLDVFASKHKTSVYAHIDGWAAINSKLTKLPSTQKWSFSSAPFKIKDITVTAFKVPHDSACCVGYTFECNGKKISITTDLGKTDEAILKYISGSQLVYLEANHNVQMLKNNPNYSVVLKNRILSNFGHLSNEACAKIVAYLAQNGTRQIVLSHLSKENNRPDIAYSEITTYLSARGIIEGQHIKIDVATPAPGKIFKIS